MYRMINHATNYFSRFIICILEYEENKKIEYQYEEENKSTDEWEGK